jgi:predicted dehydrogenase
MRPLRFAVLGTGFWANYQIPAWQELPGVELVAVYNRTRHRAEAAAARFGVPAVYDDVERLLDSERLDFVDIITDVDTHAPLTRLAAARGLAVICQKPLAPDRATARAVVADTARQGVPFFVHENFRWQAPIRALRAALDAGTIGRPFAARVSFCSAFPVFENQPFLAELEHFILTDIGSHVLDVCRFLFGEARTLHAHTQRVNPAIRGEDVAHVFMQMESGLSCFAEMSYASIRAREAFPETHVLVEGERGSLHLTHDYTLRTTTRAGTTSRVVEPRRYPWADPAYAVVHSSIVDCNRDLLGGLRGGPAETTGADNLRTVELVWASYDSAARGELIRFGTD